MESVQHEQVAEGVQHVLNQIRKGQVTSGQQLEQLLQETCIEDPQQRAYLQTVISNLYPDVQEASDNSGMQQDSMQHLQQRSRALADATNRTATGPAQAAGATKQHPAGSKEGSSFSVGHQVTSSAAAMSAQWSHASSVTADAAQQAAAAGTDGRSTQPISLAVAATPEQLSMLVTAATAAATRAVAETLLHSRQSRRGSKDSAVSRDHSAQQLPRHAQEQQQAQDRQQQQQQVARERSLQQPEQQLLRFAETPAAGASGAPSASTSGLLSRQLSGTAAAAAPGKTVRVAPSQGPIIRVPAAAAIAADEGPPAGLVVSGVDAAQGAVCFPRLWPEPAAQEAPDHAQQQEQQQGQLAAEHSRVSLAAEPSSGAAGAVQANMACTPSKQQLHLAVDSIIAGNDNFVSASIDAPAAAGAAAGADKAAPAAHRSDTSAATLAGQVSGDASLLQTPAQAAAAAPTNSSAPQQVSQQVPSKFQQSAVAAAAAVTPAAAGDRSSTASTAAAAAEVAQATAAKPTAALQPVQLPVELESAVQRALKALTDPTPPRPLLAPDQTPAAVLQQQRRHEEADRAALQLLGSRFDYTAALQRLHEAAAAVQDLAAAASRAGASCNSTSAGAPSSMTGPRTSAGADAAGGEGVGAWLCVMPPLARFYQQEDTWQDLNRFTAAVDAEVAWRLATAAAAPGAGGKGKPAAAGAAGRTAGVSFAEDMPSAQQLAGAGAHAAGDTATPKNGTAGSATAVTPTKAAAAASRSPGKPSAAAAAAAAGAAEQQRTPTKAKAPSAATGAPSPGKASPAAAAAAAAKTKSVAVAFGRRVDAPLPAPSGSVRPRSATIGSSSSSGRRLPAAAVAAMAPQGPQQQLPCVVEPGPPAAKRRKQTPTYAIKKAAAAAGAVVRGGNALQRLQARRLAARAAAAAVGGEQAGSSAAVLGSALSGLAGAGSIGASEVLDMLVDAMMDMPQQQQQQQPMSVAGHVAERLQPGRQGDAPAHAAALDAPAGSDSKAATATATAAEAAAAGGPADQPLNRWLAQRTSLQQLRQFAAVHDMPGPFNTHASLPPSAAAMQAQGHGDEEDALLQWWHQVQQQQQQQPPGLMVPQPAASAGFSGFAGQRPWGSLLMPPAAAHQQPDFAGNTAAAAATAAGSNSWLADPQQQQEQQQELDIEAELLELLVDEIMGQRLLQRSQAAATAKPASGLPSASAAGMGDRLQGQALPQQQQQRQQVAGADDALAAAVEEDMALLQSLREALLVWKPPALGTPAAAAAAGRRAATSTAQSKQVLTSKTAKQQEQGGVVVSASQLKRQRGKLGMLPGMRRQPQQQQQQQQGQSWQQAPEQSGPHQQQQQQEWQAPQPPQQWQHWWRQQEQQVQQLWDPTSQLQVHLEPQQQHPRQQQEQQLQEALLHAPRARSRQQRRSLGYLPGLVCGVQGLQQASRQQQQQQQQQELPAGWVLQSEGLADLQAEAAAAAAAAAGFQEVEQHHHQQRPAVAAQGAGGQQPGRHLGLADAGAGQHTGTAAEASGFAGTELAVKSGSGSSSTTYAATATAQAAGAEQPAAQGDAVAQPAAVNAAAAAADGGGGGMRDNHSQLERAVLTDASTQARADAQSPAAAAVPAIQMSLPNSACFRDSTGSLATVSVSLSTATTSNSRAASRQRHRYSQDKYSQDLPSSRDSGGLATAPWWERQQQQEQQQHAGLSDRLSDGESEGGYVDDFEPADAEMSQEESTAEDGAQVEGKGGTEGTCGTSQQEAAAVAIARSPPQQQQQQQEQSDMAGAPSNPQQQQQQQWVGDSATAQLPPQQQKQQQGLGGGWLPDMLQEFARSPAATDADSAVAGMGPGWDVGSPAGSRSTVGLAANLSTKQQQQQQQQQEEQKEQQGSHQQGEVEACQAGAAVPPLLTAGKSPILLWRPTHASPAAATVSGSTASRPPGSNSRSLHSVGDSSSNRSPEATLLRFLNSTPPTGASAGVSSGKVSGLAQPAGIVMAGRPAAGAERSSLLRLSSTYHTPVNVTSGSSTGGSGGSRSSGNASGSGSGSHKLMLPTETAVLLAMATEAARQKLPSPGTGDLSQLAGFDPETSLAQLSSISELSELSSSSSDEPTAAAAAAAAAGALGAPGLLEFLPVSLTAAAAGGMLPQDTSYLSADTDVGRSSETGGTSISSGSSDTWGDTNWLQWLVARGLSQGASGAGCEGVGLLAGGQRGGEGSEGLATMAAVLRSSMAGLPPDQVLQLMQQQIGGSGIHTVPAAAAAGGVAGGGHVGQDNADLQQHQQQLLQQRPRDEDIDGHISSCSSGESLEGDQPGALTELTAVSSSTNTSSDWLAG